MNAAARLAEIQERADQATDGPWRSRELDDYDEETPDAVDVLGPGPSTIAMASARDWDSDYDPEMFANAEFIAHARADVPALVAALTLVLNRHSEHANAPGLCLWCEQPYPCSERRDVEAALRETS